MAEAGQGCCGRVAFPSAVGRLPAGQSSAGHRVDAGPVAGPPPQCCPARPCHGAKGTHMNTHIPMVVPLKICPVAPTGVAVYTDQISGMVLWSVLWLFGI